MARSGGSAEPWPQTVAAFERLVVRVQDELVHFAYCRLLSRADAEDVVQDVLVRAYQERARYCAVIQVRAYLYRMVANRATDLLRERQRAARRTAPESAPPAPDPTAERLQEIEGLLSRLPRRQAEAVRLRVFAELPFQEIAEASGVSLPTAKSRFRYGVERLRALLTKEGKR